MNRDIVHFYRESLRGLWTGFWKLAALEFASRAPMYLLPWVWMSLVDNLVHGKSAGRLAASGLAFAAVMCAQALFAQWRTLSACRFGERISRRLRQELWSVAAIERRLPAREAGERAARLRGLLSSDIGQLEGFLGGALPGLIASGAVLALLCLFTAWLSLPVLLFIGALSPFFLLGALAFRARLRRDSLALQQSQERVHGTVDEGVSALTQIRAGRAGAWWGVSILETAFRLRHERAWDQARSLALRSGLSALAFAAFGTAVTIFSAYEVWRGALALGAWVAISDMWLGMVGEGRRAMGEIRSAILTQASAERVAEFLARDDAESPVPATSPATGSKALALRNVRFSRGERTIVRGESLTIEPGRLTVLAGPSGSGKTTLCLLAAGLLAPDSGQVAFDGKPLEEWSPEELRERVAIVFQDPLFFEGTLRENLLMGRDVEERRVWETLESVNARGIVESLPGGLEGRVAARGASLSLGERRRLALARALLRDPLVIVADEPLSALDERNAEACLDALRAFAARGGGLLLVSHSADVVAKADCLLELRHHPPSGS